VKILATKKAEQNRAVVDPWTVVHFASGLALGLVNAPLRWWLPVATAYEVAEHYLEESDVGQEVFDTSGPEAVPNAMLDIAVFAAGHQLGRLWNRTGRR
jgi:hypothetical protein